MAQQNSCSQTLSYAQLLYDEGKLHQIPIALGTCLESGFSQEERVKAYRLLTLSYLFTDQLSQAKKSLRNLLRLSPDFVATPDNAPMALVQLYSSFRTSPLLTLSLIGGPNQTYVAANTRHGTTHTGEAPGAYKSSSGIHTGVGINLYISNRISLQGQVLYNSRGFKYSNVLLGYSTLSYQEKQQLLEVPINVFYHFGKSRAVPYIFAGFKYQFLLGATADASRQQDIGKNLQTTGIDILGQRQRLNMEAQLGAGIHYRIKRMGLFFQTSYSRGVFEQQVPNLRYSSPVLLYQYGYVDDDFHLHQVNFQVGVTYSIYRPKELRNKKFKEVGSGIDLAQD